MRELRLQTCLSKAGVASRRRVVAYIEAGRVRVNSKIVLKKGYRVDTSKDKVFVDGKPVEIRQKKHYLLLNKPAGVLSTAKDEFDRKKVTDYSISPGIRLYPVGRLDKDTTGLLLLTDDGELTYRLTHPRFNIDRVYEVTIRAFVEEEKLNRLIKGLYIDGKLARVRKITIKKKLPNLSIVLVTMREGRKREVRRMFDRIDYNVSRLARISYGPLRLGGLKAGGVRELTVQEVNKLKGAVGLGRDEAE